MIIAYAALGCFGIILLLQKAYKTGFVIKTVFLKKSHNIQITGIYKRIKLIAVNWQLPKEQQSRLFLCKVF